MPFKTAIIERYRRRESSVEELLVEMYQAGVSMRRVEDITEAPLRERGLERIRLVISDKSLGRLEALGEFYPAAQWQRCVVHFYRNVLHAVPCGQAKTVALVLKAIHAQEDKHATRRKAGEVANKLKAIRLNKAASIIESGSDETLSYYGFPPTHWRHIRTSNPLERLNREIRRRTRVMGSFPDGHAALMLGPPACATLLDKNGECKGT